MKAYNNDQKLKADLLSEIKAHQAADQYIKGTYEDSDGYVFKGCAVGCAIHSLNKLQNKEMSYKDHSALAEATGIPEWMHRLQDTIFEGLPLERAIQWPYEFAEAAQVGAGLDKIKYPFLIIICKSTLDTFNYSEFPDVKKAIDDVITLLESGCEDKEKLNVAARAARAAWAAGAARAAAWAAAEAAEAAAEAAEAAAAAARAAARATGVEKYEYFADELLRLMRECKSEVE